MHVQLLIHFISLAAKIAIAMTWKSPVIDLSMLKRKFTWIMLIEKIVSVLQDKQSFFKKNGIHGSHICHCLWTSGGCVAG